MVLFPNGGLGRLLLAIIIITTISYLVINLVSFGGNRWITYVDVPVRFGLWRVCDTTAPGLCNSWASQFASNITNYTFNGSKPSYVRASQALEIISLIFYIIAAGLIAIGIVNIQQFPYEVAFLGAAGLLFISIVFISSSLGLMSAQGRHNHPLAFLDWAWWNGLAGLLITMLCFVSLLSLMAYLRISSSSSRALPSPKAQSSFSGGGMWNRPPRPSMGMVGNIPPILTTNNLMNQPYNNYSIPNQYFPQNYSDQFFQNPLMAYGGQSPSIHYGGQNPFGQYFNEQNPSPIVSELARQYVYQISDSQYQKQLLEPYRQYLQDPYLINNYL